MKCDLPPDGHDGPCAAIPETPAQSGEEKDDPTLEILNRIQSYLGNGGLFNPELMEHDKVSKLILDCREYISLRNPQFKTNNKGFYE